MMIVADNGAKLIQLVMFGLHSARPQLTPTTFWTLSIQLCLYSRELQTPVSK